MKINLFHRNNVADEIVGTESAAESTKLSYSLRGVGNFFWFSNKMEDLKRRSSLSVAEIPDPDDESDNQKSKITDVANR